MIITIDGPAGAGKSTISQLLAQSLDYARIDTGALYRAVAYAAQRAGLGPTDEGLGVFVAQMDLRHEGGELTLAGEPLGAHLRTPQISHAASQYAASAQVREALLGLQRRLGAQGRAIFDGRDLGTVVFPQADVKIFLTASVEARAQRRQLELRGRGIEQPLEQVMAEIEARDHADRTRPIAPLRQAQDAVCVDATALSPPEVVARCLAVVRQRQAQMPPEA